MFVKISVYKHVPGGDFFVGPPSASQQSVPLMVNDVSLVV